MERDSHVLEKAILISWSQEQIIHQVLVRISYIVMSVVSPRSLA